MMEKMCLLEERENGMVGSVIFVSKNEIAENGNITNLLAKLKQISNRNLNKTKQKRFQN